MRRLVVILALGLAAAAPAAAFDSGPHFDITRDALQAEGFGDDAISIVQINNSFIDLYEKADKVPNSGHAGPINRILGGVLKAENWRASVINAADRSHFDSTDGGFSNAHAIGAEWDRLRRTTSALAREARDRNDPEMLMAVLGISLHQVQDFYSHTNWLESRSALGGSGPDLAAMGLGRTPTYFDVPRAISDTLPIYAEHSTGITRDHGPWNASGGLSPGMAKDWQGRPLYTEAYIAGYFATRQWVQAVRAEVVDEAFWNRALTLRASRRGDLVADVAGARGMALASGHWYGEGEVCNPVAEGGGICGPKDGVGGDLLDLRSVVKSYFTGGPTTYRRRFEALVVRVNDRSAVEGAVFPVASSIPMQQHTRFVQLAITRLAQIDRLDLPPLKPDMYVTARIAGQDFSSGVINNKATFTFPRPYAPFRFLKALTTDASFGVPVSSVRVRVRTGRAVGAGTDDSVYLRINDGVRLQLDRRAYNDFERGDNDWYSLPLDALARRGLSIGDIHFLQIEKSRDGVGGAWQLAGVDVVINGRHVVHEPAVNRWLKGGSRTWRAPGFVPGIPVGAEVPVVLQLWDEDTTSMTGGDDHADTNAFAGRRDEVLAYPPGTSLVRPLSGGDTDGGRLRDGDRGSISVRIGTVTPEVGQLLLPIPPPAPVPTPPTTPPAPPAPPTPPVANVDLRISAFAAGTVTVVNSGTTDAGSFALVTDDGLGTVLIPGLAAGASVTRTYTTNCSSTRTATVDPLNQVAETDETNNTSTIVIVC